MALVCPSARHRQLQNHAACVHQTQLLHTEIPTIAGVEQLVVEMDGTLIPIVEAPDAVDEATR